MVMPLCSSSRLLYCLRFFLLLVVSVVQRHFPTIARQTATLPLLSMDVLAQAITKLESSSEQACLNLVSLYAQPLEDSS
jgi:hypothetical protein